jgi:opacity protein-like surface antigen
MRKYLMLSAALSALFVAGAASAADLPSRRAPTFTTTETVTSAPWRYVGLSAGTNFDRTWTGGLVAGFEVNSYVGIEATYDYRFREYLNADDRSHRVALNVLPQYRIGNLTPYLLAGVGYEWSNLRGDQAIYNVGGGVRFDVTREVQLDARYRYTNTFDRDVLTKYRDGDHTFTAGVNYRF